jgi:arsenate reductase
MDFVLTVCDNAAGEVCPIWPGQPISAHWGVEDPASVEGTTEEKEKAFSNVFMILNRRISLFTSLPMASLDRISLHREVKNIGQI